MTGLQREPDELDDAGEDECPYCGETECELTCTAAIVARGTELR